MKLKKYGEEFELEFKKAYYANNNNVAIMVYTTDGEPFCNLTVNLEKVEKNLAYIDVNNCPNEIIEELEKNGDIIKMHCSIHSGYVFYPLYNVGNLISKIKEV